MIELEKPECCPECGSKYVEPIFAHWCDPQYVGYLCRQCYRTDDLDIYVYPDAFITYKILNKEIYKQAKAVTDPLDYMNQLTVWPDPPPYDDRWIKKLAQACDLISNRDAQIDSLKKELKKYIKIIEEYNKETIKEKDDCEFCHGSKGNTKGNENIISGVIVCDCCTEAALKIQKNTRKEIFEELIDKKEENYRKIMRR